MKQNNDAIRSQLAPYTSITPLGMTAPLSDGGQYRLKAKSFLNILLCEVEEMLKALPNHICLTFSSKHPLNTCNGAAI